MAIIDILKKKSREADLSERGPKKSKKKEGGEKEAFPVSEKSLKERKGIKSRDFKKKKEGSFLQSYKILKGPHVTEKAGDLAEKNQYVFRVFQKANKVEIKKAIENYYEVDVVSIKIINVSPRKRRLGKIQGKSPGYKKTIVKIKKGQKIEVLPR